MSIVPSTQIIGWEEIVTTGTIKKCPLGTRASTEDGRVYRYSKSGGIIPAGAIAVSADPTGWGMAQSSDCVRVPAGSTVTSTMSNFALNTTARSNATALAADTFADGYLFIGGTGRVSTAHGQMLQIKSHTAASAASTYPDTITVYLKDGQHFINTINTSYGFFGLIPNPYDGVYEVTTGAQPVNNVVGVPNVYVASGYYFWLQTWGPCVTETGLASTLVGTAMVACTDTASTGAAPASSGISVLQSYVGQLLHGNTSYGYSIVDLKLSP